MKISKKSLQSIVMVLIVVIVMAGFGGWVKYKVGKKNIAQEKKNTTGVDIDLTPRPIEELFASDFSRKTDNAKIECDRNKILSERERLLSEKIINVDDINRLTLNEECLWIYEGKDFKFSFNNYDNSVIFTGGSDVAVSIQKYERLIKKYERKERRSEFFVKKGIEQEIGGYLNDYKKLFYNDELTWLSYTGEKKFGVSSSKLFRVRHYINNHGVSIYKVHHEIYTNDDKAAPGKFVNINIIMLGYDGHSFPEVFSESNDILKDFLDTVEPIKN